MSAKKLVHRILIVLCVLAAGALVAVWNRSYSRHDRVHWVRWQEQGDLVSVRLSGFDVAMGCVQYISDQSIQSNDPAEIQQMQNIAGRFQPNGTPYRPSRPSRHLVRGDSDSLMAALGFEFRDTGPDEITARHIEIAVPFWALFCAVLAYPVVHYIRGVLHRHRSERQTLSLCPRCGEPLAARATHCACCDRPVVLISEA